jgi:hypothetical protein
MNDRIIAFCGLTCSECEAYQATQANDDAWKERVAAKWREDFNSPDIDVVAVTCDGCLATNGRLGSYCSMCEIRACGVQQGIANCAACADYPSCEKIAGFFKMAPQAKATLDALRGG